ncbi:MAG: hypothetical protein U1F20_03885 [Lysobacterales bacterium]
MDPAFIPRRPEFHHHDYRIAIGAGCAKPYSASVFNISAMSFGALSRTRSARSTRARSSAASTTAAGEVRCRRTTARTAATLSEIGSGYFGCRNDDGSFNAGNSPAGRAW